MRNPPVAPIKCKARPCSIVHDETERRLEPRFVLSSRRRSVGRLYDLTTTGRFQQRIVRMESFPSRSTLRELWCGPDSRVEAIAAFCLGEVLVALVALGNGFTLVSVVTQRTPKLILRIPLIPLLGPWCAWPPCSGGGGIGLIGGVELCLL